MIKAYGVTSGTGYYDNKVQQKKNSADKVKDSNGNNVVSFTANEDFKTLIKDFKLPRKICWVFNWKEYKGSSPMEYSVLKLKPTVLPNLKLIFLFKKLGFVISLNEVMFLLLCSWI
mgnify:CR=1 FL=1